ncbi:hypothetical protein [Vibrio phage RYC]|nr:hypothetical protein [Vibrio phage RYC]
MQLLVGILIVVLSTITASFLSDSIMEKGKLENGWAPLIWTASWVVTFSLLFYMTVSAFLGGFDV